MVREVLYDRDGHHKFNEDWLPHRGGSDIWQIQGVFRESAIRQAVYSFRMSVHLVSCGLFSYSAVHFSLEDLLHAQSFSERHCFRSFAGEKEGLDIDADSILFGESAHILQEGRLLAMRLRHAEAGLDLRLERTQNECWYGDDGMMPLGSRPRRPEQLHSCVLPQLACEGRYYTGGQSVRVDGLAAVERLWGRHSLRLAHSHWEHFYLFFDNGDQVSLYDFPYAHNGNSGQAFFAGRDRRPQQLDNFSSEAIDFVEVDEWRFASGWRLELPGYGLQTYYLIPLIKEQYCLPVSRPVLGIFDKNGEHLGYAACELLPAARNELKIINPAMFCPPAQQKNKAAKNEKAPKAAPAEPDAERGEE